MSDRWTNAILPLVVRIVILDSCVLTWASLGIAIASFYLISQAGDDPTGALWIIGGVFLILFAGILDALDGALARHQGTDGPYGDFLDHTIDRVVDVGLLVAIGMNANFVDDYSTGLLAGLLTLFGSYMGTQAQSVGVGRIYGGFSRADRMVLTILALLVVSWQAYTGTAGISVDSMHWIMEVFNLGNGELNGMTFALAISAWGGVYTFMIRFLKTRTQLL